MLRTKSKKVLLGFHISLKSVWIGTLTSMLLLLLVKSGGFQIYQFAIIDKVIFQLFDSIIINISIATAITGLVFSLFTTLGFTKFYWIISNWIAILILAFMIMFLHAPSINGMAALSDVHEAAILSISEYLEFQWKAAFYCIIQIIILLIVVFISTLKPWGQRHLKRKPNRKIVMTMGILLGLLLLSSPLSQYFQLRRIRALPVKQVDLTKIEDGYYDGEYNFFFDYKIGLNIQDHQIKKVEIINNRDGHYARLAEGITEKIIRQQNISIEAVTGATTTGKLFLKAAEVALTKETVQP